MVDSASTRRTRRPATAGCALRRERLVRDARVLAIGGGATEVMLEEVAKRFEVPQWS